MRDNPVLGCLAMVGAAVLVVFLLSLCWGFVVSGGPILGGLVVVGVFFLGLFLGGSSR